MPCIEHYKNDLYTVDILNNFVLQDEFVAINLAVSVTVNLHVPKVKKLN